MCTIIPVSITRFIRLRFRCSTTASSSVSSSGTTQAGIRTSCARVIQFI